ncbi:Homoserine kinase [Lactococcus lactis]|nr:Homoserine kinase [Lactococcus lactis]
MIYDKNKYFLDRKLSLKMIGEKKESNFWNNSFMKNIVTARAHTNIALIKYWGKADIALNIPTTSSLSMTLEPFYTTTSVEFTDNESDSLILNSAVADSSRVSQFLEMMRGQYGNFPKVMIQSENHVPTAAGLASSASSFAALTAAMFGLLDLEKDDSEMSRIARRGSGSASRSIFGNFSVWNKGKIINLPLRNLFTTKILVFQ